MSVHTFLNTLSIDCWLRCALKGSGGGDIHCGANIEGPAIILSALWFNDTEVGVDLLGKNAN